jgi:antitoxin VapB
MPLNVKDEEAHSLARDLARETGESLTQAVKQALRERLDRVRRRRRGKATAEELLAIGRRFASGVKKRPIDHAELLYDEHGLPK